MSEPLTLDHPVPSERGGERVPAITSFRPLQTVDRWTLVEAIPHTGRMHQIRRHLKHLSHPVVGDVRYGKGEINRLFREKYRLHRLALHALSLTIRHPDGHVLRLHSPFPNDLLDPIRALGFDCGVIRQKPW